MALLKQRFFSPFRKLIKMSWDHIVRMILALCDAIRYIIHPSSCASCHKLRFHHLPTRSQKSITVHMRWVFISIPIRTHSLTDLLLSLDLRTTGWAYGRGWGSWVEGNGALDQIWGGCGGGLRSLGQTACCLSLIPLAAQFASLPGNGRCPPGS